MSSQFESDTGQGTGQNGSQRKSGEKATPSTICWMCQQPIKKTGRLWRGEPVHYQCGAEFRYRVSANDETDE